MIEIRGLSAALAAALAGSEARIADAIAREVPADVGVARTAQGLALTGRSLSVRSLADARLRDFTGLVSAGGGR